MKKSNFVERAKIFFGGTGTPGMIRSGLGERMLLLLGFTRIRRRFKYLNVVVGGEEEQDDEWKDFPRTFTPGLAARKAVHVSRNPVTYLEARLLRAKKAGKAKGVKVYEEALGYVKDGIIWAEWMKYECFRTLTWEYEDTPF